MGYEEDVAFGRVGINRLPVPDNLFDDAGGEVLDFVGAEVVGIAKPIGGSPREFKDEVTGGFGEPVLFAALTESFGQIRFLTVHIMKNVIRKKSAKNLLIYKDRKGRF